jgi:ankyrin repeat protein
VLLEYGANKDGQVPSSGVTPLMAAVQEGHCDVVDALLVARAGVDVADNAGRTPLHEACRAGNREMCAILLAAGASVSARDHVRPPP